jgi:acyl carrier protein
MPDEATLNGVIEIIADTFGGGTAGLGPESVADDIDGWDSVSHTMLMLALEDRFGVTLAFEETVRLPNLAALADHILSKRG